eukprot:1567350-Rhodomonas_salina.1
MRWQSRAGRPRSVSRRLVLTCVDVDVGLEQHAAFRSTCGAISANERVSRWYQELKEAQELLDRSASEGRIMGRGLDESRRKRAGRAVLMSDSCSLQSSRLERDVCRCNAPDAVSRQLSCKS